MPQQGRQLDDFVNGWLEHTKNSESPISYNLWSAISTVASALQRRVCMHWDDIIYPNLYVVLVGPSGARKAQPINVSKDLLQQVGVPLVAEKITKEKIARFFVENIGQFTDPRTQRIEWHCSITAAVEELQVFMGLRDTERLADMTNWYDSRDAWRYETKNQGSDKVQGVCFNLLAATAPDWLPSILSQEALGGGWTSRVVFVVETRKRQSVPDPFVNQPDQRLRGLLIHDLEQIKMLAGEYSFTPEARRNYIDWYASEDRRTMAGNPTIVDPRFDGYCSRRGTLIKKISICMAASQSNELKITPVAFQRALKLMADAEKKMTRVFAGIGQSKFANATDKILSILQAKGSITRSTLLRGLYRDVDAWTLEGVERVLSQMGAVKITRDVTKGEVVYTYLPPETRDGEVTRISFEPQP